MHGLLISVPRYYRLTAYWPTGSPSRILNIRWQTEARWLSSGWDSGSQMPLPRSAVVTSGDFFWTSCYCEVNGFSDFLLINRLEKNYLKLFLEGHGPHRPPSFATFAILHNVVASFFTCNGEHLYQCLPLQCMRQRNIGRHVCIACIR